MSIGLVVYHRSCLVCRVAASAAIDAKYGYNGIFKCICKMVCLQVTLVMCFAFVFSAGSVRL